VAKIETLIGFAVKAQKIIYGADRIFNNKNAKLIVICKSLADNSKKKIFDKVLPTQKIIESKNLLENIVFKTNCKVIAITDINFIKAILENFNENYTLLN